eukprot:g24394.t1
MTPGASTVFNQMSMREPSVGGGTEGTSVSGLDFSEASDFLPTVGMMPKKEMLHKVFHRLADDGEVHKDVLSQSLELLGIRHIKQPWIEKILLSVTRYTTLSLDEYMNFVHAYMDLQSKEYESAFYQLDKDGSGTIEANHWHVQLAGTSAGAPQAGELSELLLSIGITPMDHVINELSEEFDVDHSGDMNLEEFCRLLAVINEREGFSKVEYDRAILALLAGRAPNLQLSGRIVKHIDQDERYAAAKWIVSTLSQDRQLYVSSLLELGFEFDADPDMTEFATFIEASMSQCAFMFRDSIPSSSQMNFLQQMQEHQEREENQETKVGKEQSRLVGKIPGVVLFFLRGLEMLQNICGMLEVTVPFASIMLENCMPLLVSRGLWDPAAALPGPPGQSVVEQKVRAKLHELDSMGLVLGAQVAAWDRRLGSRGDFLCNVACGRIGPAQGIPISDQTVMPLMSLSAGPLLHCLLRAISQPTVQGLFFFLWKHRAALTALVRTSRQANVTGDFFGGDMARFLPEGEECFDW